MISVTVFFFLPFPSVLCPASVSFFYFPCRFPASFLLVFFLRFPACCPFVSPSFSSLFVVPALFPFFSPPFQPSVSSKLFYQPFSRNVFLACVIFYAHGFSCTVFLSIWFIFEFHSMLPRCLGAFFCFIFRLVTCFRFPFPFPFPCFVPAAPSFFSFPSRVSLPPLLSLVPFLRCGFDRVVAAVISVRKVLSKTI